MMPSPIFTIICPILNADSSTIHRLVSSLNTQTYQSWSLLFINANGSKSQQTSLLLNLANSNSRIFVRPDLPESSIYSAMNYGFSLSEPNSWRIFWGADDYCASPYVFSTLAHYINSHRVSSPIFTKARFVTSTNTIFRTVNFPDFLPPRISLFLGFSPAHQSVILPPGYSSHLPLYETHFRVAADLDFFFKLINKSRIYINNTICLAHVQCDGFSTRNQIKKYQEVISIYKSFFGYLFFFPLLLRYIYKGSYAAMLKFIRFFHYFA